MSLGVSEWFGFDAFVRLRCAFRQNMLSDSFFQQLLEFLLGDENGRGDMLMSRRNQYLTANGQRSLDKVPTSDALWRSARVLVSESP